jgi:DNA-directed RNA polymerase specialized sigma24 family protein
MAAPSRFGFSSEVDLDVHLTAIRAGDAEAFGRWVAGCEFRLRGSLKRFAAQVDVEAVLQETLLRVWQVAPRFEPDGKPDALVRFGIRTGRNVAISEMRRLRCKHRVVDEHASEESVEPVEPDPMLREVIASCRDKLPPKPAQALQQRLESAGAVPDKLLAARVDMQTNTFLQNVTRARKLLLACLERNGIQLEAVMR